MSCLRKIFESNKLSTNWKIQTLIDQSWNFDLFFFWHVPILSKNNPTLVFKKGILITEV